MFMLMVVVLLFVRQEVEGLVQLWCCFLVAWWCSWCKYLQWWSDWVGMMLILYWFNNEKVMALVKKLVETVMVMMIVVVKVIVMVGCGDCNCKGLTRRGWTIGSGSWWIIFSDYMTWVGMIMVLDLDGDACNCKGLTGRSWRRYWFKSEGFCLRCMIGRLPLTWLKGRSMKVTMEQMTKRQNYEITRRWCKKWQNDKTMFATGWRRRLG